MDRIQDACVIDILSKWWHQTSTTIFPKDTQQEVNTSWVSEHFAQMSFKKEKRLICVNRNNG